MYYGLGGGVRNSCKSRFIRVLARACERSGEEGFAAPR